VLFLLLLERRKEGDASSCGMWDARGDNDEEDNEDNDEDDDKDHTSLGDYAGGDRTGNF
jgi:hypothetical protein